MYVGGRDGVGVWRWGWYGVCRDSVGVWKWRVVCGCVGMV